MQIFFFDNSWLIPKTSLFGLGDMDVKSATAEQVKKIVNLFIEPIYFIRQIRAKIDLKYSKKI